MTSLPVKSLGTEFLMSFSGRQHFTCLVTNHCWESYVSCVTPLGEDSWKLVPGFLQALPHAPSPFVDYVLYPFTIINDNRE